MDFMDHLVDIHAHILPGIDDGPSNLAEAQELLSQMSQTGVAAAYCTSHYLHPFFPSTYLAMVEGFETLLQELQSRTAQTPLLALGAEVRITDALLDDIMANTVPRLGSTMYVLLELPTLALPTLTYDVLYELQIRGYQPIIAHPERNLTLQKDPKVINRLLDCGALLQLSAGCFHAPTRRITRHQKISSKFAWALLKEGKVALIASDAHNVSSRGPTLHVAYETIANNFGSVCAEVLAENAQMVWRGELCKSVEMTEVTVQSAVRLVLRTRTHKPGIQRGKARVKAILGRTVSVFPRR